MAITQADVDSLTAALIGGEKQVVIGNQSITYRSIDEIVKARDILIAELAAQDALLSGVRRRKVFNLYESGRGFDDCPRGFY